MSQGSRLRRQPWADEYKPFGLKTFCEELRTDEKTWNIATVTIYVLNLGVCIWALLLPRDDSFIKTMLADVEKKLSQWQDDNALHDPLAKPTANNKSIAKVSTNISLQSMLTQGYVSRFETYRMASHMFLAMILIDMIFIALMVARKTHKKAAWTETGVRPFGDY
jgi:hypothetical protein